MKTYRPLILIVTAYSFGIMADLFVTIPFYYLIILTLSCLWLSTCLFYKSRSSQFFLLLVFVCLGFLAVLSEQNLHKHHISYVAKYYYGKPIELRGVIISDITKRQIPKSGKTTFTLELKDMKTRWGYKKIKGKVLVHVFRKYHATYGDYLSLKGKLHRPFNFANDSPFSYREYLKNKGILWILSVKKDANIEVLNHHQGFVLKSWSLRMRNKLKDKLESTLTPNEAGIMNAILLGERSRIPKHIRALFVRTGTAHILAISGLHVGIVAGIFLVFLKILPMGRKGQLFLTIILLIIYASLTGARPSVIRATIMTVVFLASFIVEKEADTLNTLFLAAGIILLMNPLNLFDLGFQLSFVCVFFIILLEPKMRFFCSKVFPLPDSRVGKILIRSASISLAAWLGVVGLIVYYFNIITPVTIIANLLVVPLISVTVALGLGLLIFGGIFPVLISFFALCIKLSLNLMVGFIYLFEKLPFAYFYIFDVTIWHIICYYLIIFLFSYCLRATMFCKFKEICLLNHKSTS